MTGVCRHQDRVSVTSVKKIQKLITRIYCVRNVKVAIHALLEGKIGLSIPTKHYGKYSCICLFLGI